MAAVARIVGVPFLRHRFVAGLRAMRVMAGHAVHLPGEQRMCSRFKEIRFLFSVAGNAKRRGRPDHLKQHQPYGSNGRKHTPPVRSHAQNVQCFCSPSFRRQLVQTAFDAFKFSSLIKPFTSFLNVN